MSIFAIGDTHLSLSGNKSMDVFPGWENYVDLLSARWTSLVKDTDTVVIAGDVSWALKYSDAVEDFRFLDSLPGKKLIMKGNHDFWWQTMAKNEAFLRSNSFETISFLFNNAYRIGDYVICGSRGWFYDDVDDDDRKVLKREAGRLKISIDCAKQLTDDNEKIIAFLHYPPLTKTQFCDEIFEVLKNEGIRRVYYAHLHGPAHKLSFIGNYEGIGFNLISADFLSFYPYLVEKF